MAVVWERAEMLFKRYTSFCLFLLHFSSQNGLGSSSLNDCNRPLGLQDGRISNSQLSSPAYFEHFYIGNGKSVNLKPEYARLNNTFAWCSPSRRNSYSAYIEIDLKQRANVSGIAVQGFMGINPYYVKQYKVAYGSDRVMWKFLKGVFRGNSDAQTVVKSNFNPVISARFLRIYPKTYNYRVCMRLELYGCTNLTMDHTNPRLPVDPTPTVTAPTTAVAHEHQSTKTSSLIVTPTLSSVKVATPTPSSTNIRATNHTPTSVNKRNESLHTTTLRVPWSEVSHETAVLTQRDKNVGEGKAIDHEPEHVPTRLVIVFSITAAFLVLVVVPAIMFLLFLLHRKQKRCKGPSSGDSGIPLTTAVIDENLYNRELYETYMYAVPKEKCGVVETSFLNGSAV